jgi:hypothetical protein
MVVTTVALRREVYRRLQIAAVDENAAITELVRQAVQAWLGNRDYWARRRGRRSGRERGRSA